MTMPKLQIRLSEDERDRLKSLASQRGQTMSGYVRQAVLSGGDHACVGVPLTEGPAAGDVTPLPVSADPPESNRCLKCGKTSTHLAGCPNEER